MGTRLVIRTATDVDAEAIASVHVAAWREAELWKPGPIVNRTTPKKASEFASEHTGPRHEPSNIYSNRICESFGASLQENWFQ